jgi:hypothetical protein
MKKTKVEKIAIIILFAMFAVMSVSLFIGCFIPCQVLAYIFAISAIIMIITFGCLITF